MKKRKSSLFLKASIGILGTTTILGGVGATLASCTTTNSSTINQEVSKYYKDFLNNTHARWAGNISNYGIDNLNTSEVEIEGVTEKVQAYVGLKNTSIKPLYDLNTSVYDSSQSNFGSYHAYLWLKNQLKNMGFEDITGDTFTYPNDENNYDKIAKKTNASYSKHNLETNNVSDTDFNNITKTGIVTQPFLWHGTDSVNVVESYNNRAQNLIATIVGTKALSSETNKATKIMKDFYIVSHYDSTSNVGTEGVSWGATDNGTGVAVNLSIANYFKNNSDQLNEDIRLHIIFSDAEEVGVKGSWAFANQYLSNTNTSVTTPLNNIGMINLDTIAGGDYIYVHSPMTKTSSTSEDTSTTTTTPNTSTTIRDQINALSRIRAVNMGDTNQELLIHPQVELTSEYKPGETGDWSDHAPFYKSGIPVAYMESTNFQIKSRYDSYDGYSQTLNPNAYILNDGSSLASKALTLKSRKINGSELVVYDAPDEEGYNSFSDYYKVAGDIWHSDLDSFSWTNKYLGSRIYKQLTTMFETLKLYIQTSIA